MTELVLEALGIGAFIFIILTIFYYGADFLGLYKIVKALKRFHKGIEITALALGFVHGYYMANGKGEALAGYFAWLVLALLIFSTLFFAPNDPGYRWKGYITALIVLLMLFASMHVFSVSVGFPVFEIVDPLLTA